MKVGSHPPSAELGIGPCKAPRPAFDLPVKSPPTKDTDRQLFFPPSESLYETALSRKM